MNLAQYHTKEQLRGLVAGCNDNESDHILWVAESGAVHLTSVADELPKRQFNNAESIQFRFDVWPQGQGTVGPLAAEDESWIDELYECLLWAWKDNRWGIVDLPIRRLTQQAP